MIPNAVRGNSFRGLLDYLFDVKAFSSQGKSEKQPQILNSNMGGQTARELAREFGVVRSLNPKIHKPVWHVSLAFAIGERPPDELLDRIPELFINKVGAQASAGEIGIDSERNQWVAVSHHDKDHFHFHLVVNRINYEGKVCYCKWDKNRSQQACREIEQELGLVQVKGDSARLFLDGRFVAHLEAEATRTGVVDPRLERYRTERETRLKEIYEQQSDRAELVRATTGRMSQRDAVGAAGATTGSPDADAAGATTRAAGLAWFQHQCEQNFRGTLKRVLAALDRADDAVRDGEPEIEKRDHSSSGTEAKSPEQPETPVVAPQPVNPALPPLLNPSEKQEYQGFLDMFYDLWKQNAAGSRLDGNRYWVEWSGDPGQIKVGRQGNASPLIGAQRDVTTESWKITQADINSNDRQYFQAMRKRWELEKKIAASTNKSPKREEEGR